MPSTIKKTTTKKTPAKRAYKSHNPDTTDSLDPRVFGYTVKPALLAQVLHVYRSTSHQDTSKVKTRGELTKTTRKMFKQKGTGNARHGSRMAPQFVGGGIAHGPTGVQPANLKVNRKMKAAALAGILTLFAKENKVQLVSVPEVKRPSVKDTKSLFGQVDTLLVYGTKEPSVFINSIRNLKNITPVAASQLTAYQIAQSRHIALTPSAHEIIVSRLTPLLKSKKST